MHNYAKQPNNKVGKYKIFTNLIIEKKFDIIHFKSWKFKEAK